MRKEKFAVIVILLMLYASLVNVTYAWFMRSFSSPAMMSARSLNSGSQGIDVELICSETGYLGLPGETVALSENIIKRGKEDYSCAYVFKLTYEADDTENHIENLMLDAPGVTLMEDPGQTGKACAYYGTFPAGAAELNLGELLATFDGSPSEEAAVFTIDATLDVCQATKEAVIEYFGLTSGQLGDAAFVFPADSGGGHFE